MGAPNSLTRAAPERGLPAVAGPGAKVAHFIPYLGRAQGGPVVGLGGYASALTEAGWRVTVLAAIRQSDGDQVVFSPQVEVVKETCPEWESFRRCPQLWHEAARRDWSVVHSHGLWTDVHRLAAVVARQRGLPHLVAPCGMLAPKALRHHWWKKLPVRLWFQARALRAATCLHAKSRFEYDHIHRFGLRNPVAIVPNPIPPPPTDGALCGEAFRRSHQIPAGKRVALFLGRLHRVKGLARLVRAWPAVSAPNPQWLLVIAGPDEGGHRAELESLVARVGCQCSVVFTGQLDDSQRWAALAAADLFVMPSDFENFGNAIVEAMSCAIPVITTTGTPWQDLPGAGAGWCVRPEVEELAEALREALALSDAQRQAMGRRASTLAERFRPERVADELIQVYQWLLGTAQTPACVLL